MLTVNFMIQFFRTWMPQVAPKVKIFWGMINKLFCKLIILYIENTCRFVLEDIRRRTFQVCGLHYSRRTSVLFPMQAILCTATSCQCRGTEYDCNARTSIHKEPTSFLQKRKKNIDIWSEFEISKRYALNVRRIYCSTTRRIFYWYIIFFQLPFHHWCIVCNRSIALPFSIRTDFVC